VCERKYFCRHNVEAFVHRSKANHSFALLDLLRPMADPDVGNIQLAPCEEEKALYIAVVREKVLTGLKYALATERNTHLQSKRKGGNCRCRPN
jgi:hypothetical protein